MLIPLRLIHSTQHATLLLPCFFHAAIFSPWRAWAWQSWSCSPHWHRGVPLECTALLPGSRSVQSLEINLSSSLSHWATHPKGMLRQVFPQVAHGISKLVVPFIWRHRNLHRQDAWLQHKGQQKLMRLPPLSSWMHLLRKPVSQIKLYIIFVAAPHSATYLNNGILNKLASSHQHQK